MRLAGLMLVMFVASSLFAVATAAPPGPTTTSRTECNAGCSRGCTKVKGSSNYECKSCKRGFARQGGNSQTCNYCAPGYGTAIADGLSPSVRRGFVACKREPCNRCSACPQGTTSKGGARGTAGTTVANGTIATCVSGTPVSFKLTITTNPVLAAGGSFVCSTQPDFAPILAGLITTSINAQGGFGASATLSTPCVVNGDQAASYTFDVSYNGLESIKAAILASQTQDCQQSSATSQTGGICSAMPNAAGSSNICVAFTAATAGTGSNFILCNGAGVSSFIQSIATTTDTTTLPVTCDPSFFDLLKQLMEASLSARPDVAGALVTRVPPGTCTVADGGQSAIYNVNVFFYGKQSLEDQLKAQSLAPVNALAYTGGVCDAFPKADGNNNLCAAFVGKTPKGAIIKTGAFVVNGSASSNNTVPTSTIALGVTTAQTTAVCQDDVGKTLAANMRQSLLDQTTLAVTNETIANVQGCSALSTANSSAFTVADGKLYIAADGNLYSGPALGALASLEGVGLLDLKLYGIDAPKHRRRLQQTGEQTNLFLVIYNIIITVVAATTPQNPITFTQLQTFTTNIETTASDPTKGIDAAFPTKTGVALSVIVTQEVLFLRPTLGVSILIVEKTYIITETPDVPTTTTFTGIKQAIRVTSYGVDPAVLCADLSVRKAMVDGIVASLEAIPDQYFLPTSSYLGCAPEGTDYVVFTIMTSWKGTKSDNQALIDACSAGPFSICAADAYSLLCPAIATATAPLGTPQQVLCVLGATTSCPADCAPGTWRNGQQSTTCDFVLGGFWYDGSAAQKCPAGTYAPSVPARSIPNGEATQESCLLCPAGTSTNGLTGATKCGFVAAGFFYDSALQVATPCPVNSYSATVRTIEAAAACTPCDPGFSTFGKIGQTTCVAETGTVPPGKKWDGTAAVDCEPGTFAPFARPVASAASCYPCATLISYNDRNPITLENYALVASGSIAGATSCTCPANTYFSVGTDPTNPAAACVACPQGSTSNTDGAVIVDACAANCKAGYWGNPNRASVYGQQCRACPTMTPGTSPSSTPGVSPVGSTGVPQASCTICSPLGSLIAGSGTPAACKACDVGKAGESCTDSAPGYKADGSACGSAYDFSAVAGPAPGDNCGGCAAGKTGAACDGSCSSPPADAPAGTATWVSPMKPSFDDSNCVWGCPVGHGISADGKSCAACSGTQYSPGTKTTGVHPVCLACPPGSEPDAASSNARCKTFNKAALESTEEGLFDEFD